MRDKRIWILFLSPVAVAIWGWNIFQLMPSGLQKTKQWSDIPTIPSEITEDALAPVLPPLKRDPFQWQSGSAVPPTHEPTPVNYRHKRPRINIPRGQLSLILERGEHMEAIYLENGVDRTLKINSKIGDWRVVNVKLEKVELEHSNGKVHVLSIP